MNLRAVWAIYAFEMDRTRRTAHAEHRRAR